MHWLRWSQLPLLIIIQLLEPSRSNQKVYAEALLAFKSAVSNPQQLSSLVGRYPCLRPRTGVICAHKLNSPAIFPLLPGTHLLHPQSKAIKVSPRVLATFPSQHLTTLRANFYKSRKTGIAATVNGNIGVPTLTPSQAAHVENPQKQNTIAIVGGCVGAALLVTITVLLVYFCLMRARRRLVRRTSETGSSLPSPVELAGGNRSPNAGASSPYETQNLRQLTITELEHATSGFNHRNVIGEGGFGLVYKGLLQDGSLAAIKRRQHDPNQYFVEEVKNIGCIRHRHLVKLIGYCQESHQQLLVYDYLPNGNVGNHLYDSEGLPVGKLDIQQRLHIALGAAKGLEYLHSLVPPFLHMHFRTRNVLLDENFSAKVSDFGLLKLQFDGSRAGSSFSFDCFLDPELSSSNGFSQQSDVYSFGVFLLELIGGREAFCMSQWESQQNLVMEAKGGSNFDGFIDKTLREKTKDAMQWTMALALQCLDISTRRPTMKMVVGELELIQEREIGRPGADLGEDINVVFGSELFK